MPLTTADRAFGAIALQKKYLTRDALSAKESEVEKLRASGERIALADLLLEQSLIDAAKKSEIEKIRSRHGRTCEACSRETFLLPGDKDGQRPCEFCGGKLKAGSTQPAPPKSGASPAAPKPAPKPGPPKSGPSPTTPAMRPAQRPAAPSPSQQETRPPPAAAPLERARPARKEPLEVAPPAKGKMSRHAAAGLEYEPPPPAPPPEPEPTPEATEAPVEAPPEGAPEVTGDEKLVTVNFEPPPPVRAPGEGFALKGVAPGEKPRVQTVATPLVSEMTEILSIPLRGRGILFITLGALLAGLFVYMGTHAGIFGIFVVPPMGMILIYVNAFQQKTANASTAGNRELPDWPDWEETTGLGLRLLGIELAAFGPLLLLLFPLLFGSARKIAQLPTIGNGADGIGAKSPEAVGKSVAEAVLYDKKDEEVKLGDRKGRWLVLALLERETGDDTGTDRAMRLIPQAGPGLSYAPGFQPVDLLRVKSALPDMDLAVVFIDPGRRFFKMYGIVGPDPINRAHEPREGEDEEPAHAIDLVTKLPIVVKPGETHAAGDLVYLRTHDIRMPDGFEARPKVPTIWVIDPKGVVRKEYEGGVRDQVLYAAVKDLRAGGDGNVDPEILPLAAYGIEESLALWIMSWVFGLAGVLYYPMALLMGTVFTSGTVGFQYPVGIRSIAKTAKDYFLLVGLFAAVLIGSRLVGDVLSILIRNHGPPFVSGVFVQWVRSWLALYAALVVCVGIGRFYVRHHRTLAWLDIEDEPAG